MTARLAVLFALLAAALTLAACGGGDESSAERYANDICEDMSAWIPTLADAGARLSESGLSAAGLEDAAKDVREPTRRLIDELNQLGPPEAEKGEEAYKKVGAFAEALRELTIVIEQTLDSDPGLAARVETVAIAVSVAGRTGKALFEELRLNSGNELGNAFYESTECESLGSRMSGLGD